ncbi:MAG: hypothetical protein ACOX7K_08275 [Oscillospiraceae bacterium]|jgi:predicted small lipoprotein YifL
MKRTFLLPICLLLITGMLLGLTACGDKPDTEKTTPQNTSSDTNKQATNADIETAEDYNFQDDLPAIEKSNAAYLLDPNFAITGGNFSDCIYDYFTVDAMLYFQNCFEETPQKIKNAVKAKAFGEVFRNISPSPFSGQLAEEDYQKDYTAHYSFQNAIGRIAVYVHVGQITHTFIALYRDNESVQDVSYFFINGDLTPELYRIGESLKETASDTIWDDLPAVETSDAAYLRDLNFTVTTENFSGCVEDYLTAPATLYFDDAFHGSIKIEDPKEIDAFVAAFRSTPLIQISKEEYHDDFGWDCRFRNAIGQIAIHGYGDNLIYLEFCRESDAGWNTTYFYAEDSFAEGNLVYDLKQIVTFPVDAVSADEDSYNIWDEIPAITRSKAAHLLNLETPITEKNASDCIYNYFTAPATLYFSNCFEGTRRIKDQEKTKAFAELFRDLPLTQISEEEYLDDYGSQYSFLSAIGNLSLYTYQNHTYISFFREGNSNWERTYFCAEGNLLPELNRIGQSLKNDSEKPAPFEMAENWG